MGVFSVWLSPRTTSTSDTILHWSDLSVCVGQIPNRFPTVGFTISYKTPKNKVLLKFEYFFHFIIFLESKWEVGVRD